MRKFRVDSRTFVIARNWMSFNFTRRCEQEILLNIEASQTRKEASRKYVCWCMNAWLRHSSKQLRQSQAQHAEVLAGLLASECVKTRLWWCWCVLPIVGTQERERGQGQIRISPSCSANLRFVPLANSSSLVLLEMGSGRAQHNTPCCSS